jgi:endonuclease-3 related protein
VVIVGAILVQQTAWPNAERALDNLRAAGALSTAGMRVLTEDDLAAIVRPSGFYRGKARKLRAFLDLLYDRFDGDLDRMLAAPGEILRPLLLATHGIGPETADSILLYAAGRPYFVIDAYARRVFTRIGVQPGHDTYDAWQRLFMEALPADAATFNEYHALLVEHGKQTCRPVPLCESCPVLALCEYGRMQTGGRL